MEDEYRSRIIELVCSIDNKTFLKTVYNFIVALKKKWGI